jgi:ketosteroid isomerase-like protein
MTRRLVTVPAGLALALPLAFGACRAPGTTGEVPAELAADSAGHGAPVDSSGDRAADERAIRELANLWGGAVVVRDTAAIADLQAPDARLLLPGRPAIEGRDAVTAAWARRLALPGLSLTWDPTTVEVAASRDLAVEVGTYEQTVEDAAGPVSERGSYLIVWRRLDGEWKAWIGVPLAGTAAGDTAAAGAAPGPTQEEQP